MAKRGNGGVLDLTVLIYPCRENPGRFVAHCLEMDVLAVEDTKPKAILLLKELLEEHIEASLEDNALDQAMRPAPREFWQMLGRATRYKAPASVKQRRINSPPVKSVNYALALA